MLDDPADSGLEATLIMTLNLEVGFEYLEKLYLKDVNYYKEDPNRIKALGYFYVKNKEFKKAISQF